MTVQYDFKSYCKAIVIFKFWSWAERLEAQNKEYCRDKCSASRSLVQGEGGVSYQKINGFVTTRLYFGGNKLDPYLISYTKIIKFGKIKLFYFVCKMTEQYLSEHDIKPRHKKILD